MAMTFRIDWVIEKTRWADARQVVQENAPGSEYDLRNNAFWWLLSGELQFRHDNIALFPQDRIRSDLELRRAAMMEMGDPWYPIPDLVAITGMSFSILDFVSQFLRIVAALQATGDHPTEARFSGKARGWQIGFTRIGGVVTISTDLYPDIHLHVRDNEFLPEAHRFLDEFIVALNQHVPGILEWVSFERLRSYGQSRRVIPGS